MAGVAAVALLVLPVLFVSAYRRGRAGDYRRSPEFRMIVGDFLI
jgi:hypothetical protein